MRSTEVLTEFLGLVSYPVDKAQLVEAAHNHRMRRDIIRAVEALPNRVFASLEAVVPYIREGEKDHMTEQAAAELSAVKVKAAYDHWLYDILAPHRPNSALAQEKRERESRRSVYNYRDDDGRSQNT